jgi:hypothetical protein
MDRLKELNKELNKIKEEIDLIKSQSTSKKTIKKESITFIVEDIEKVFDNSELKYSTKINYKNFLYSLTKNSKLTWSYEELIKHILTFKTLSTQIQKLSALLKFMRYYENKYNTKMFEELMDKLKKKQIEEKEEKTNSSINEHFDTLTVEEMKEITMKSKIKNEFKLLLLLNLNHPSLRCKDYISIKMKGFDKEKDNYIDGKYLVFNDLCKTNVGGRINIKLTEEEKKLYKKCEKKKYLLHDDEYETNEQKLYTDKKVNKHINKITKELFDFNFHEFRKITYRELGGIDKEMLKKYVNTAKLQNHSLNTAMEYYM